MTNFRPGALRALMAVALCAVGLSGCGTGAVETLPPAASPAASAGETAQPYVIGPMDQLSIFVWRNPELSAKVQVRPDGQITTPLITDMPATGKTPTQLADDIAQALSRYVEAPRVSVTVEQFSGTFSQQVRVVGATEKPASLPYRADMTLLDAIIAVGGLSEYADGNRARLIRTDRQTGEQKSYALKIDQLLHKGDANANVRLQPGDVIIIPSSLF